MNLDALESIKRRFAFGSWSHRNRLDRALHVVSYFVGRETLPEWSLHRITRLERDGRPVVATIWRSGEDDPARLLRVDFVEAFSRPDAHEAVPHVLGQVQSPEVQLLESSEIGDVAFGAPGGGALIFARANLVLMVAGIGRQPLDPAPIASRLDRALITEPEPNVPAPRMTARLEAMPLDHAATLGRISDYSSAPGTTGPLALELEWRAVSPVMPQAPWARAVSSAMPETSRAGAEPPAMLKVFGRHCELLDDRGRIVAVPSDPARSPEVTVCCVEKDGPISVVGATGQPGPRPAERGTPRKKRNGPGRGKDAPGSQ